MPDSASPEVRLGPALEITELQIAFPGVGPVLTIPGFHLAGGTAVAIEGPSGAGKTSLLHALAGLERPGRGEVRWGEVPIWSLSRAERDRWRREALGLVFQDIHLVDGLSAIENVTLPLLFDHVRVPTGLRERAGALLDQLGLGSPDRPITVMSRGERQRVALARALLRGPTLILADEPTASLDRRSAEEVAGLMLDAVAASGATLVVTSHDPALLARAPTRLRLEAGLLQPA